MKPYILVASANVNFRASLTETLESFGYETRIATVSGHIDQQIVRMRESLIGIIIDGSTIQPTDTQMETLAGIIPIVMLTTAAGAPDEIPSVPLDSAAASSSVSIADIVQYLENWHPMHEAVAA